MTSDGPGRVSRRETCRRRWPRRAVVRDDLLGAHPYRPASKLIPPLVLMGRHDEALAHAEPMWAGWRRSGAPIAAWAAPAASAVALAYGLRGDRTSCLRWRDRAARAAGSADAAGRRRFAVFADARVAAQVSANASAADVGALAAVAELAVVTVAPDVDALLARADPGENAWAAECVLRAARRRARPR